MSTIPLEKMTEVQFRLHHMECFAVKDKTEAEIEHFKAIVQEAVRRDFNEEQARQGWLVRNKKA
jgi:hypothetical protein